MAESLLCILLTTSSVRESTVVYCWPDNPKPSPRLTRPLPNKTLSISLLDNPWRASNDDDLVRQQQQRSPPTSEFNYAWPRPHLLRPRSHSTSSSHSRSSSLRCDDKDPVPENQYNHLLGFDSEFLARLLCPHKSMSHQKFELMVDDLAFIGHPVSADSDGNWSFKSENTRSRDITPPPEVVRDRSHSSTASNSSWLQTFHLVLVLDVPDPSSSASGNISKYFGILYEQIAFTLTAVLYQEQVLSNFVERECDTLISLRETSISKGEPYSRFLHQALESTSIAPALKTLFDAIKSSSVAYLTINYLPLELQLPPYLDTLLLHNQNQEEQDDIDPAPAVSDFNHPSGDEAYHALEDVAIFNWGQDSTGWKLPFVAPWKTLLLLDDDDDNGDVLDPHRQQLDSQEDKNLAEGLVRFLETVSVILSLAETARLLDWDLETQVYPIVKWLVLHRRAKVVDVVHPGLRTVFALPPKFSAPLSELTQCFQSKFSHPSIPPLPLLLSQISLSLSKPPTSTSHPHLTRPDNHAHFFASVVKSKDLIPMYHDVVLWMMKKDLLVVSHLRVRIVATMEVKARVKRMRERWIRRRARRVAEGERHGKAGGEDEVNRLGGVYYDFHNGSRNGIYRHHNRHNHPIGSNDVRENLTDEGVNDATDAEDEGEEREEDEQSDDEDDSGWETSLEEGGDVDIDDISPSIISDPGKATHLERRWLAAMSSGKIPGIVRRFELVNQHFDGKRSDDEILYRAEITRKQLREVLHHYEEYLQTFLHQS